MEDTTAAAAEASATAAAASATASATSATEASTSATNAANSATAAANSAASAGAVLWVSGTSYAVGYVVYSPINFQNYRCIVATSGTTDPSLDETNWLQLGGGGGGLTEQTATTTATTETAIATYVAADYTAMELTVVADSGGERTITKLLVVHNGTTASATQYGEVSTATVLSTYDVDVSGSNVRLLATPASATSTNFTTKENLFAPL
jgi:hypothetical protein